VSTDTTIPHTPHVYLLPFGTVGFFAALAAGFFATLAAGFAAAFVFRAGVFAALAAGFAAAFGAGFAAGLLFVAIVLPPFDFFTASISLFYAY
jgi:hypothetical protein